MGYGAAVGSTYKLASKKAARFFIFFKVIQCLMNSMPSLLAPVKLIYKHFD
jgi:hypothetical protein